jgi:5'-3' exonuclease
MRYLLIDTANTFFRARHTASRASDDNEKIGYALHITMSSINRICRQFPADHIMFALEGRSWRKDHYEPYKKNRAVARAAQTASQQKEDQLFWETYDRFVEYLKNQTNCSVIQHPNAEADDIIARWIALHPNDEHVIISSDTDFVQLLTPTVRQYNGITDELITVEGIFDSKGQLCRDRRTRQPRPVPDPEWLLFEKCMRGDPTDNIFSAYPNVRLKSSKNKIGLLEAFQDRNHRGFAWNNLMLQRWVDHLGIEHRVIDDYQRNRVLIDLRAQPDWVKQAVDQAIQTQIRTQDVGQVGTKFIKFCGKFELIKLSESSEQYGRWLNQKYQGILDDSSETSIKK